MSDELTALRLQIEWGADEALDAVPIDRFVALAPPPPPRRTGAPPRPLPRSVAPSAPQADTVEGLFAEWDAVTSHPLRMTATHTVRPAGNAASGLIVVGDAPGSDDDRSGQAFSGPSGQLLDRVFSSAGFDRGSMLLSTIVPWRPPGNRPLSEAEIQSCRPFVQRLLSIVRPHHLVLVGSATVRALTGETGTARRLRGRWLPVQIDELQLTVPALALPPIDQWLHNSATKQQLWADLLMLRDAVTTAGK